LKYFTLNKEWYNQTERTERKIKEMSTPTSEQSKLCLSSVQNIKTEGKNLECSICYKRIYKRAFICSEPCNNVFHTTCMEKMIYQECAMMTGIRVPNRCCYCRRNINMNNYNLELYSNKLLMYKNLGYDISSAVKTITERFGPESGEVNNDEHWLLYIGLPRPAVFQEYKYANFKVKNTTKRPIIINVKKNRGGRKVSK
jgi:hypothetical protein